MKKLILFLVYAATMTVGCTTKVIYTPFLAPAADSAGRDLFQFYGYEDSLGRWHEWGYPVWKRTLDTPPNVPQANAVADPPREATYFRDQNPNVHHAIMSYYDSIESAEILRTDSVVLNLDSVTLLARSGNPEAQRQLDARHAIEGDINGAWASDELIARDDSMKIQIVQIKARVALSDSARTQLDRLGKP